MPFVEWPVWVEYTLIGLIVSYFMFACGMILARVGRSPGWCLLLLLPFVQVIALWVFAYSKWPAKDQ